jgi:hypothetical protein
MIDIKRDEPDEPDDTALRGDLRRRCIQLGISCVEWESQRPPDETSIALVTPESALQRDHHVFESPMHDVPVRSDCHQRMPCGIERPDRVCRA